MSEIKRLRLRRPDVCQCGAELAVGSEAGWDRSTRQVHCLDCLAGANLSEDAAVQVALMATVAPMPAEAGVPGASLMRTYENRQASRDKRVREKHPRIGGMLLKLYPESDSAKAFRVGAEGEQQMAARFEKSCPDPLFLHNRRPGIGEKLGDIDHIVVTPSGVFVVDPKNYRNAKVEVVRTGFLDRGEVKLMVRGRDQSKLLESLRKQKAAVESALDAPQFGGVAVSASFCFIDAYLPMFKKLSVDSFAILGPSQTVKVLNSPGPLTAEQRLAIWDDLAFQLPSA